MKRVLQSERDGSKFIHGRHWGTRFGFKDIMVKVKAGRNQKLQNEALDEENETINRHCVSMWEL